VRKEIVEVNRNARAKQNELQIKSRRLQDVKEQLTDSNRRRDEAARLRKDVDNLHADIAAKETEVRDIDNQIDELSPQKTELENALGDIRAKHVSKESEASREVAKLAQSQSRMQTYDREIQRFVIAIESGVFCLLTSVPAFANEGTPTIKSRTSSCRSTTESKSSTMTWQQS